MPNPIGVFTLDGDDLIEFRTTRVFDQYVPYAAGPPVVNEVALSRFNQIAKRNFLSDEALQLITNDLVNRKREELESIWTGKKTERMEEGDDIATAEDEADLYQRSILFDLLEAEVRFKQLRDPAYRASLYSAGNPGLAGEVVKELRDQASSLKTAARSVTPGFAMIRVQRH